ncbi:MAG: ornithine carbamoyltransferase [Candidatus Hydrothermales bacterium]
MKRDFLSITDITLAELNRILDYSEDFKKGKSENFLKDKIFALIFEKPSLRTRVSFEAGIKKLGGHSIYLSQSDIGMGKREAVKDIAKNLERWVDSIVARVYSHETLITLAKESKVPVINALSDLEHPCQILADLMTIREISGDLNGPLLYVGDGNNVCHSLILGFAITGGEIRVSTPKGYEPKGEIMEKAKELSKETKSKIIFSYDPYEIVKGVKFIYTDVWASMGQEHEAEIRKKVFLPYQVNKNLIEKASSNVKFMHCLPAHRGEEVTDDVLDADYSIVYEQAENRMWAQMGLLKILFK